MFNQTKNEILSTYKKYREGIMVLNKKIISKYIDRQTYLISGKYLGLVSLVKKDTIIFDNESETAALMDFAINEYKINGKKAVELYKENIMTENDIEKDILDGLLTSYTSFFKIADINKHDSKVILIDLFNRDIESIQIIDIGFSQTAVSGLLIFLRIVPLASFNISGGIAFAFHNDLEENLLKEYKQIAKRVKSSNESIKKYVAFFKLNRRYGIGTEFK
jgi:hypothetical protein